VESSVKESIDLLLLKIKDNDSKALDELYDASASILYRCAFSYLKNKEDSEDALSDTFYLIVKNINKFKGKNGFNWIYTIIKNVSLNMLKKREYDYIDPSNEEDINKYNLAEEEKKKTNEKLGEVMVVAKDILKPNELNILMLHTMDEMKFKDIADILGMIEATVRWKYNNALGKLRSELERREIYYE